MSNKEPNDKLFYAFQSFQSKLFLPFFILFFVLLCATLLINEDNFGGTIFTSIGFALLIVLPLTLLFFLHSILFKFAVKFIKQTRSHKNR